MQTQRTGAKCVIQSEAIRRLLKDYVSQYLFDVLNFFFLRTSIISLHFKQDIDIRTKAYNTEKGL